MDIIFKVDNAIKQEYLDEKLIDTAKSDTFVLKAVDNFEYSIGKSVFNMNYAELNEMIARFKNSSVKSILKNVSIIKTYIDFCVGKKFVLHGENRLAMFTVKEANNFVSRQALLNKIVSKETLEDYKNLLYNPQDQLLLELPFIGVRGRTVKDCTMEEIINLTIDDVDEKNNILRLTQNNNKKRYLEVEESTIDLIKDVYEQEFYVENNGMPTNNPRFSSPRELQINKVERYIFRVPSKDKMEIFNNSLLNSRMRKMQIFLDNKYLKYTSLYESGMLNMAKNIYKEKGEITREDYAEICLRYNYISENEKITKNIIIPKKWANLRDLFNQYRELFKNDF